MLKFKINEKLIPVKELPEKECMCIMLLDEWEEFEKGSFENDRGHGGGRLGGCRAYSHRGYVSGVIKLPGMDRESGAEIRFYVSCDRLIFLCETRADLSFIEKISLEIDIQNNRPTTLFCHFLQRLVWNDALRLQAVEEEIQGFEESIETGGKKFNLEFSKFSRKLLLLDRYYDGLAAVAEELRQNDSEVLDVRETERMNLFSSRIAHLQDTVHMLREYSMQVREMYVAQIDLNQNEIMKVLTIVTTVVLPLTLIAGWYGMNFTGMPELAWKYGYITVSVLSLLVVILCIIYFKKKKFF